MGELVLGRKLGWKGMAWGLFFGTLPDLDIIFSGFFDQADRLKWHRGLSHSILAMVVGSLLFAKPLSMLHRESGVSVRRTFWFIFLVWSTHVLIDVFTTYGTQIYEPFSDRRVSLSNLFIIDLFFTLPLLVCLGVRLWRVLWRFICWYRRDRESEEEFEMENWKPMSWTLVRNAVVLSCLYVCFSFVMKVWATDRIRANLEDQVPGARLVTVTPSPLNTILWRGLAETDEGYFVTYWSPMDSKAGGFDYMPKQRELVEKFEGEKLLESLKWFSRGHWVARKSEEGKVVFIDMRFGEIRNVEHEQLMPMFQWHLSYDEDGKMRGDSYRPKDIRLGESLGLIWERLRGEQGRWEKMKSF